jgi:hypothetical protein
MTDLLEVHFPGHLAAEKEAEWEKAKFRFPLGTSVNGIVLLSPPFGCFLDIQSGFPAVLLATRFSPPLSGPDALPQPGSTLEARVVKHVESDRQFVLSQDER